MTEETDPQTSPQTEGQSPQSPADEGPKPQVEVQDAGNLKKKIIVTIPAQRVQDKRDEMFGELKNSAQVPGFRVGHAPRRLIEKRFAKEISDDVRNGLIGEGLQAAMSMEDLKVIGEPDMKLDDIQLPEEGDMVFDFEVEVAPEIELPNLEGIRVEKTKGEVTDEKIDAFLDNIRNSRAKVEDSDGAVVKGEPLVASVKISGEGIEEVLHPGMSLRAAPQQVEGLPLVDLGDKLEGLQAGQSATLSVTVPDTHANEAWHGKEMTVEVTVTQVRKRILPEVDEAFAEQIGFESVDELRGYVRQRLESELETETRRSMEEQVRKYLMDNTEVEVPEGAAKRHAARVLQRRYVQLLQMGMPQEMIEERITDLQTRAAEEAKEELKLQFILGKIIDDNDIDVSEADVNAQIAQMAMYQNRRPERMRQEMESDGSLERIRESLREDKALVTVLDKADIVEVDQPAEQADDSSEAAQPQE